MADETIGLTTVAPAGDDPEEAMSEVEDALTTSGREAPGGFAFVVPWFAEAPRALDGVFGPAW